MAKLKGSKKLTLFSKDNEIIVWDMNQDMEAFAELLEKKKVIGYYLVMTYMEDEDTQAISCGFIGRYNSIMQSAYKGMLLMKEQYEKDTMITGTKH